MAVVASHYGISEYDLIGPSRRMKIVEPRYLAIWLARRHTDLSLPAIGRKFGGRDHTTVMHGLRSISAKMEKDADLKSDAMEMAEAIKRIDAVAKKEGQPMEKLSSSQTAFQREAIIEEALAKVFDRDGFEVFSDHYDRYLGLMGPIVVNCVEMEIEVSLSELARELERML